MAEPLQEILNQMVTILKNAATEAGERVHLRRSTPTSPDELPCIVVHPMEEETTVEELGPQAETDHDLLVGVAAVVAGDEPASSQLLTLREQIRAALEADSDLGGLVLDLRPEGADWPPLDARGEIQLSVVRLRYQVLFVSRP
jgi:hypothetical protein